MRALLRVTSLKNHGVEVAKAVVCVAACDDTGTSTVVARLKEEVNAKL